MRSDQIPSLQAALEHGPERCMGDWQMKAHLIRRSSALAAVCDIVQYTRALLQPPAAALHVASPLRRSKQPLRLQPTTCGQAACLPARDKRARCSTG